jgi:hypothetical protein
LGVISATLRRRAMMMLIPNPHSLQLDNRSEDRLLRPILGGTRSVSIGDWQRAPMTGLNSVAFGAVSHLTAGRGQRGRR